MAYSTKLSKQILVITFSFQYSRQKSVSLTFWTIENIKTTKLELGTYLYCFLFVLHSIQPGKGLRIFPCLFQDTSHWRQLCLSVVKASLQQNLCSTLNNVQRGVLIVEIPISFSAIPSKHIPKCL